MNDSPAKQPANTLDVEGKDHKACDDLDFRGERAESHFVLPRSAPWGYV